MQMKKSITVIIATALAGIILVSACMKDDMKELVSTEKKLIQQYLTDHNISAETKTSGGIYYIEQVQGTGLSPKQDNYVFITYTGRYIEDGTVIETSYDTVEWDAADYFDDYLFGPLKIVYGYSMLGINEALSYMKEGGKATVILPSDKANYDYRPLVYELELLKVVRDPIAYEDSVLEAYLSQKGYDNSALVDGIWFKENYVPDPADLATVELNDTVYLRFEGRLIDGFTNPSSDSRVFDSNLGDAKPLKYVYGSKVTSGTILNQTIPAGLKTAIDSMRVGVKATAILPYSKAFGENGVVHSVYNYTIVPKYQSVLYNIEVTAIKSPAR
jgi:FKBP-type peptidyl-prolyl cis-trans isomerase